MKLHKRIWNLLPNNALKERIRILKHNYRHGNAVKVSLSKGVYKSEMGAIKFNTYDYPFAIFNNAKIYENKHVVSKGEVVFDAGAYTGHLSVYFAAKAGSSGRVIAVEPDSGNMRGLARNIALNESSRDIVIVKSKLLWSCETEIAFCEQGTVSSSAFWFPAGKTISVKRTTTIDEIVRDLNLKRVDFIKMDIEGAEIEALTGAAQTIKEFMPDFAVASYHLVNGKPTYPVVESLLVDHGYNTETIFFGKECVTYATKA